MKRKKEAKKDIPKKFFKQIQKLGLRKEDAEILFETKVDWTAVYSDNKIYCTEVGCDFYTTIDKDVLTSHAKTVHYYGDYPCPDEYCNYIGYSKVGFQTEIRSLISWKAILLDLWKI